MYTQIHTVLNDSGRPIRMSTVRAIHDYSATSVRLVRDTGTSLEPCCPTKYVKYQADVDA